MMRKVLTALLVIVLLALLAVLSWMVVLYLQWPFWGVFAIFFGVIAAYFGLKALRTIFVRTRVKARLLATESKAAMVASQQLDFKHDLLEKWKSAVGLLKKSQLRKFGNPLYVLPWYMVMGESGAGKTTAITRSRLTPMLRETAQTKQIAQTSSCDWWFFSEAVVIDTAGRYVSPDGDARDHEEWDYLLELFGKYRAREGLNGLVVAIDAPTLLGGDVATIESRGRSLRDRIDQLMRLFEKRFPIYIMVTKCDQIYGFTEWAEQLTDEQSQEAMGFLSGEAKGIGDEQYFATHALQTMSDRLDRLRLDMAMRGVALTPEMLLLPDEVTRLNSGLQWFLKSALGHNPYLEDPFLRGLFLTSGRQDSPLPSLLGQLLASVPQAAQGTAKPKGLFIHDIFSRILPKERNTALPGQIVSRWRRVTANMALVSWLSLCVAAMVFLVVSYQSTSATIKRFATAIPENFGELSSESASKETEIEQLSNGLMVVGLILKEESNWNTRWLAFNPEVNALENKLKQVYVRKFRQVQNSLSGVNIDVQTLLKSPDPTTRAYALLTLVRYINMVQARVNGADYQQILAMPQVPQQTIDALDPELSKRLSAGFSDLLVAAIAWSPTDDRYLTDSLREDREMLLAEIFKTPQMEWLLDWANSLPVVSPITLGEFWNPDVVTRVGLQIDGGLTLRGKGRIDEFVAELQKALQNSNEIVKASNDFYVWYREERLNAWRSLAWGIMEGENLLVTEPDFRNVVASLGTVNSPFNLFFKKLQSEFEDVPANQSPSWLEFARYYIRLADQAKSNPTIKGAAGLVNAVNSVGGQALRDSLAQGTNLVPGEITRARDDITLFEQYVTERQAAAVEVMRGVNAAYDMSSQYFGGTTGPEASASVLARMDQNFQAFKANSRYTSADDEVIWRVIEGPVDTIKHYALEQASCKIQQDWEKDVMWKTQLAVNPQELSNQLFGEQGTVWTFVDGPAKNFITRVGGSLLPATVSGYQFPFASGYIGFLNQAVTNRVSAVVRQQLAKASTTKSAKLSLAASPIGVNDGAKARPYAAILSIQCAQEAIELSNLNMEASDTFEWKPDQCGEVTLDIEIDNLTLTKRYPGQLGLSMFLQEFQDGARVFTPADFPAAMQQLDDLNVREITLRYDIQGRDDVLRLAEDYSYVLEQTTPSTLPAVSRLDIEVPARAGSCWTTSTAPQISLTVPRIIEEQVQKKVNPPPKPPEPPLPPIEPLKPVPTKEITIVEGDTLFSIGRRYRVDLMILRDLNSLKTDKIVVGQKLLVPIWPDVVGPAN
ncbi:type VI secretion protein IcmF/TssM N-terminal domain-containing protein [Orrella daihaiensis]|uniref:LysM peptidoglycan-binding domain-containing protein n=1 Tax=Orrella daihaiensis TaxID=2782176 RepID=A0ABY4ALW6_9BURK|nr:type VI secretion protein IcmF/TssM N-terminal domain-containing protein [Orrella daihaiensis]UOD50062.1 LysM peptidoglycan-binding domain-containing protein [Orrella daihaiensis]